MSRYRGPRLRIIRRLGELPGFTKKNLNRTNPPGQHGMNTKKPSQYGIRLQEKQKLRYNYGITERQLINYLRQARKIKGSTGEILLQLLEMRLDNIVFRLSLAPTIAAARQLISHGHIKVNNKKVNIPSYQCKPNDIISISEKKHSQELITKFLEITNQVSIPPHLSFNKENLIGKVHSLINREFVGLNLNELLVIEFYSRKL
uniref:Small ribosomal subunit protein uS4c n=1 Tax=Gloeotilopsis sterilis TaxID=160069 RepID=A0A097KNP3_GLOST|nr:ribosomal protein S4 [Gloeotilopsis sterilis]AIT94803.1 ribosomal protein S4 [Gloeotilopsis sterilis]